MDHGKDHGVGSNRGCTSPSDTNHHVDANLRHDMLAGRAVTGALHLVNKTPADWFAEKQATVETATCGSKFVAAHVAAEQVIDLHTPLRHLDVPVREKSCMFGDNKCVINSATAPHAKLHKCHNALPFH
jgi:hypothetical protein